MLAFFSALELASHLLLEHGKQHTLQPGSSPELRTRNLKKSARKLWGTGRDEGRLQSRHKWLHARQHHLLRIIQNAANPVCLCLVCLGSKSYNIATYRAVTGD